MHGITIYIKCGFIAHEGQKAALLSRLHGSPDPMLSLVYHNSLVLHLFCLSLPLESTCTLQKALMSFNGIISAAPALFLSLFLSDRLHARLLC